MANSTKIRILQQVRKLIDTGQIRYICFALDHIIANDHRRLVQAAASDLQERFRRDLFGHKSLGYFLTSRNLPLTANTLTLARLAWIDRTLETLP